MTCTHLTVNREHLFSVDYFVQSTVTDTMGQKYKNQNKTKQKINPNKARYRDGKSNTFNREWQLQTRMQLSPEQCPGTVSKTAQVLWGKSSRCNYYQS